MTDTAFEERLAAIESAAEILLAQVTGKYLREHLELAIRDVAESRAWARGGHNEVANLAAAFAGQKLAFVQRVVEKFGVDVQEAGG